MVSPFAQILVVVHKGMLVLLGLGVVCLGASRFYVMCQRGFAHFLQLVDSEQWDKDIAALRRHAKEVAAQAERTAAHRRLRGELETGGALPARLDVVCAGGGLEVSYACGVLLALREGDASILRTAGANSGAQAGFAMMTGQFDSSVRFGMAVACTLEKYPWMRPGPMWDFFCRRCACRAPVPTEGSLAVSVTELRSLLPIHGVNRLVSTFEGKEALGEALVASAAVPWLTCRGPWASWRGARWLDGGLTSSVPHFRDGRRAQLVITYDFLEQRPRGRCRGIYLRSTDVLEVLRRGIEDGAALLAGERPAGLRVLSPEESVRIPPPPELTLLSIPALAWCALRGLVLRA